MMALMEASHSTRVPLIAVTGIAAEQFWLAPIRRYVCCCSRLSMSTLEREGIRQRCARVKSDHFMQPLHDRCINPHNSALQDQADETISWRRHHPHLGQVPSSKVEGHDIKLDVATSALLESRLAESSHRLLQILRRSSKTIGNASLEISQNTP